MEYTQGEFQQFRVLAKIHLGSEQIDLSEGEIVEFDGASLKRGGQVYMVPAIRGAVAKQWLVPVADNVSRYIPKPAGVKVRPATPGSEAKESMELVVSNDEQEVVGGRQFSHGTPQSKAAAAAAVAVDQTDVTIDQKDNNPLKFSKEVMTEDVVGSISQDGVPVAKFSKPTNLKTTVDGIQGLNTETGPLQIEKINHNHPAPAPEPTQVETSAKTAKTEPAWDTSVHWKTRVKRALRYKDNPERIAAIKALETKTVVKAIEQSLSS